MVGGVGDLAKLIQGWERVREVEDVRTRLEHERADVFWSIIVIAARCEIDLETSFVRTMDEIEKSLNESGLAPSG